MWRTKTWSFWGIQFHFLRNETISFSENSGCTNIHTHTNIRTHTKTRCGYMQTNTRKHTNILHGDTQTHSAAFVRTQTHKPTNTLRGNVSRSQSFFRKWCDFFYVSENDVIFSMFQKMIMFSKMMFSSFVTLLRQFKHCRFFKNEKIIIFWHRMDDVKHYQAVCLRVCVFVRVETPRCVLVYHRTMCLCAFVCI